MEIKESEEIENANLVIDHFGYWPSFHDAEIISMRFFRDIQKTVNSMEMSVHAFEMTNKVVGRHYKLIKHCFVDIEFVGQRCAAYGVNGYIEARKIRINKLEILERSHVVCK